ncbi:MAG TPA: hypothetical protein VKD67_04265, partial [Acidimicrobiales bacterium]|nr:hypothetical protein [Acidimicrobiales bacterium]
MRRRSAVVRAALAGLTVTIAAVGSTLSGAGPAAAADARLIFTGPVTPHAFTGHIGLDALDSGNAKLCFSPNPTGCPAGYSSVTDWDPAGNVPSITLPAGTATAHLELYPQTRYFDRSAVDPWGDGPGGTHIWVRDLQPGETRDIGSIP